MSNEVSTTSDTDIGVTEQIECAAPYKHNLIIHMFTLPFYLTITVASCPIKTLIYVCLCQIMGEKRSWHVSRTTQHSAGDSKKTQMPNKIFYLRRAKYQIGNAWNSQPDISGSNLDRSQLHRQVFNGFEIILTMPVCHGTSSEILPSPTHIYQYNFALLNNIENVMII